MIILSHFLLHGATDNHGAVVRLSCDIRYQPAAHPTGDSRFFGPQPTNSTGGGYGDMSGAQPMSAPVLAEDRREADKPPPAAAAKL